MDNNHQLWDKIHCLAQRFANIKIEIDNMNDTIQDILVAELAKDCIEQLRASDCK